MTDDFYRRVGGVREPDPTLGKYLSRRYQAETEQLPRLPPEPAEAPPPPKVRRKRVVLADPRQQSHTLRARVELEEQTSWGELLIKDLMKAQLRTGLLLAMLVLAVLGALPLAFYFSPTFATLTFIGVPLPWLLLGVAPFPLLFGVGLWYNRLAERHERDFVDMIEN
ncbi:hypothetical protein SAMN05421810_107301 [Amycolatopsis arida]|uniref:Uncharacterized protein n=1 Tax=Amycolatopsis arida TaxID=587909 RepID=A0A1I5YPP5_9PSEU|nr:hypothetical protein [Amycolatopsis arida]TDX90654.1 hypothetical protein CLV69_107301 [Amycolatopsis arida]SFQ45917.1 hypothetical protein SAMN05421810_107301 [Amycolatopsis arida]